MIKTTVLIILTTTIALGSSPDTPTYPKPPPVPDNSPVSVKRVLPKKRQPKAFTFDLNMPPSMIGEKKAWERERFGKK